MIFFCLLDDFSYENKDERRGKKKKLRKGFDAANEDELSNIPLPLVQNFHGSTRPGTRKDGKVFFLCMLVNVTECVCACVHVCRFELYVFEH